MMRINSFVRQFSIVLREFRKDSMASKVDIYNEHQVYFPMDQVACDLDVPTKSYDNFIGGYSGYQSDAQVLTNMENFWCSSYSLMISNYTRSFHGFRRLPFHVLHGFKLIQFRRLKIWKFEVNSV